jgi:hypothetical protein
VKAASGGASVVPPNALSTKAVAMDDTHAFLEKKFLMCNFIRLSEIPKLKAHCVSDKKISCQKFEKMTSVFCKYQKMKIYIFNFHLCVASIKSSRTCHANIILNAHFRKV